MRGRRKANGFTIVETLIVLAVTGALFLAAALAISGRQARTQFQQASQDAKSRIQQVINEVASGYYANIGNFQCSPGGGGPILTSGSTPQGENTGCVFLGKVMQFGIAGTDPEEYRVFTVAGLQRDAGGNEITSYAAAAPKVIAPSASNPSVPNAAETGQQRYGLTVSDMYYGAAHTRIGAIGFANSVASYSSGSIVSGAQQLNVIPITGSALNVSALSASSTINANFATSPINPQGGVFICLASAGTNQSALITIGGGGRQLSVTMVVKENHTCA